MTDCMEVFAYTFEDVWMTQAEYEALPEFTGW